MKAIVYFDYGSPCSLWLIVKGLKVPKWNERVGLGLVGAPRPNAGVAG